MVERSSKITPPGRCAATLPIEGRERQPSATLATAKSLRKRLTGPEAKLWANLKRIKTVDTHFGKQVPIGPYIADFACLRARLIIEVDGEQHGRLPYLARDRQRARFLNSHGFTILRFWNHEVLQEMEAVLDTIYAQLHGNPWAAPVSASRNRGPRKSALLPLDGGGAERSEAEGVTPYLEGIR